jgi:hypothetical protein
MLADRQRVRIGGEPGQQQVGVRRGVGGVADQVAAHLLDDLAHQLLLLHRPVPALDPRPSGGRGHHRLHVHAGRCGLDPVALDPAAERGAGEDPDAVAGVTQPHPHGE